MTSFAPTRANPPVSRFFIFFAVVTRSRTFREISASFPQNWRNKSRNLFKSLAVELYEVTSSNKINNSALLPQDSRI